MITTDGNVTMIVIYWLNNDLYIYRWATVIIIWYQWRRRTSYIARASIVHTLRFRTPHMRIQTSATLLTSTHGLHKPKIISRYHSVSERLNEW